MISAQAIIDKTQTTDNCLSQNTLKPWFVYKYTFPNNKVYIGKSNITSKRYGNIGAYKGQVVYKAMLKYLNFKKEILCYFTTEQESYDYEIQCIQQYNSTDKQFGYNVSRGGDGVDGRLMYKPIQQYTWDGIFIKQWASIKEASKSLNINESTIITACNAKYKNKMGGGFQWKYLSDTKPIVSLPIKFNPDYIKIIQYDLNGLQIQEWESASQAANTLGLRASSIQRACQGERKSYHGFQWKRKINCCNSVSPGEVVLVHKRKIRQYDLSGQLIKIWDSTVDVAHYYNIDPTSISHACSGDRKIVAMSQWRYDSEQLDRLPPIITNRKGNKNAKKEK